MAGDRPARGTPLTPEVRVERIAAGGDGVGRLPDGRVVFVPRTAPGDLARVEVVRAKARFCRGRLLDLVEAGPGRVDPRCDHYVTDLCGGCQLQHLDPAVQQRARVAIVGDALRRIGRLDVADPDLDASGAPWAYRSRITVSRGPGGRFGFHRLDRPGHVFDLRRCEVAADRVNWLWGQVARSRDQLPPAAHRLTLRSDRSGGVHLVVETDDGNAWPGGPALHDRIRPGSEPVTVWWHPEGGAPRAVAGSAEPYPTIAFEQVNAEMGDRIRRFAIAGLGPMEGLVAWDLYAGIGESSALLAAAGARVQSVEADGRAASRAERDLRTRFPSAQVWVGRVEHLVSRLSRAGVVMTNPPRAGMDPGVVAALAGGGARRIAYVSCDPATLARDLRILVADGPYQVTTVRAFDLFPQTAHVETVALMELR